MRKIFLITIVSLIAVVVMVIGGVFAWDIYKIKTQEPTQAEIEYQEFYEKQTQKKLLTEEEFNELKRREKLLFEGKTSGKNE